MSRRGRFFFPIPASVVGGLFLATFAVAQVKPAKTPATADPGKSAAFYRPDQIQVIHLQVGESDLRKMIASLPRRIYVPAAFQWGDQRIENVGVRFKGNSSSNPRQKHKRSFLIKFAEFEKERTFLGLQRVALDNGVQFGSLFSEQLITGVLRDLNLKAPRCNFAKLYLNGAYQGVYTNVERIDSVFIKNNFSHHDGALYKNDVGGVGASLGPIPSAEDPRARTALAFEPKSPSARKDARDVRELIARINQTPADEFAEVMEKSIDLDAFLQTMAVMLFSGAFDQLTGVGPHNYYLYRDPMDERWHYLPWDLDVGFADNAFGRLPIISGWNAAWPLIGNSPSPLVERIVEDPQLLARYRRLADSILEEYFHPKVMLPKIDALHQRIQDDLADDPFPHQRVTNRDDRDYDSIIASIKSFVRQRYETARSQLDNPGTRPQNANSNGSKRKDPQPGPPSPDAPTGLRIGSSSASSVTLQWIDNAKGEAAHIVQRAEGEAGQAFRNRIGTPGADIATLTDRGLAPGQVYRYRVYAVRPSPTGPLGTGVSNTITVRLPAK